MNAARDGSTASGAPVTEVASTAAMTSLNNDASHTGQRRQGVRPVALPAPLRSRVDRPRHFQTRELAPLDARNPEAYPLVTNRSPSHSPHRAVRGATLRLRLAFAVIGGYSRL